MDMDSWLKLLDSLQFIDEDFNTRAAKLCFVRSQMRSVDMVDSHGERVKTLKLTDFLEAMCRVSECKPLPSQLWMDTMGVPDLYIYYFGKSTWRKNQSDVTSNYMADSKESGCDM